MEENRNELTGMENEDLTVIKLEESEYSGGNGLGKVLICAAVGVVAGVGALVYKNRDKIKEKQIAKCTKKLEKLGCTVVRDEEIIEDENFDDDFEEVVKEEETK